MEGRGTSQKKHKPEEVVAKLRQVDVLVSQGGSLAEAVRTIGMRPFASSHVWSYDFGQARTHDGRTFRMLNVINEFTRDCLSIRLGRQLKAPDGIDVLSDSFIQHGAPSHIRSDDGPELVARAGRNWITGVGAKCAFLEPGSP